MFCSTVTNQFILVCIVFHAIGSFILDVGDHLRYHYGTGAGVDTR